MFDETKPNFEHENNDEQRKSRLLDIEPISETHRGVESRSDLGAFVEGPLLRAAEELYDRNIQTFMSSANKQDIPLKEAAFSIIHSALSDENKAIAQKLAQERKGVLLQANEMRPDLLYIKIPVTKESTWGDIEDASVDVASRFKKQRLMPVGYTPEWVIDFHMPVIEEKIEGDTVPPEFFEQYGFFYEPQTNMFIRGKEDFRRATESLGEKDKNESVKYSKIIHKT